MSYLSSIKGKFILLLTAIVLVMSLAIKFYFIPQVDHFLELSLENDMKRNMESFVKVIHTVTVAADGDRAVVRNALDSINKDPDIPVVFRRSKSIELEYGTQPEKTPQNSVEERAFRDGAPIFRKKSKSFEYIYPLKITEACQNCHKDEKGADQVPLGYVIGLAISTVPQEILWQNKIFYFVKDMFVNNLTLVFAMLFLIFFGIWRWIFVPLNLVSARVQEITGMDEEYHEFEIGNQQHDEIETLELHINELIKKKDLEDNTSHEH